MRNTEVPVDIFEPARFRSYDIQIAVAIDVTSNCVELPGGKIMRFKVARSVVFQPRAPSSTSTSESPSRSTNNDVKEVSRFKILWLLQAGCFSQNSIPCYRTLALSLKRKPVGQSIFWGTSFELLDSE
ncbi:MAG: hypothetical protein R3C28_10935 [Pirellulaceae bacterium]